VEQQLGLGLALQPTAARLSTLKLQRDSDVRNLIAVLMREDFAAGGERAARCAVVTKTCGKIVVGEQLVKWLSDFLSVAAVGLARQLIAEPCWDHVADMPATEK